MTRQEIADAVLAAAALIRKGWCQFAAALNAAGQPVRSDSPDAVCFRLSGAVSKVTIGRKPEDYFQIFDTIRKCPSCPTVDLGGGRKQKLLIAWNDTIGRTQDEVATMLETIAKELACAAPSAAESA